MLCIFFALNFINQVDSRELSIQQLEERKKADLDNICNGVKFLIDNDNITGEIINIDGGQRLAWQTPDIINTKE